MSSKMPIIYNPFMRHPFWSGCKFVLVFFLAPLFLTMPPDLYFHIYLPLIAPMFYVREILSLVLTLVGRSDLVDNTMADIQPLYIPYWYYDNHH